MTTLKKTLTYSLIVALLSGTFLPAAVEAGRRGGSSRGRSSGGSFRRSNSSGRSSGFRQSNSRRSTPRRSTPRRSTPRRSTPRRSTPRRSTPRRSTGRINRGISRNRGVSRRGSLIRTSPGRKNVIKRGGKNILKKRSPINRRIGKGRSQRIRPINKGLRGRFLPKRRVTRNVRKYVRQKHQGMFKKNHTQWSKWLGSKHNYKWGIGNHHHHHRFLWTWVIASTVDYYNPYCVDTGFFGGNDCYDYSEAVEGSSEPTEEGLEDVADANSAFTNGDYETALAEADAAIKEMPKNADLHQFRSLILFALGRYQESAAAAHAALVNDNGWDWDTLKSFYASTDTYTAQLRALEKYTDDNPKNAPGRFLLAYHYLMLGHAKAAVKQLKVVVALEPRDELAAGILEAVAKQEKIELGPEFAPPQGEQSPTPENETPDNGGQNTKPVEPKNSPMKLVGTWKSQDAEGEPPVTLIFKADGSFSWTVKADKQQVVIAGKYAYNDGQLKLNRKEGGALEGTIAVKNSNQFVFTFKGQPKDEPGVTFNRNANGGQNGGQNAAPLPPVTTPDATPKNVTPKNVTPKNVTPENVTPENVTPKEKNVVKLQGTWKSQDAEGEPPVTLIFKADGTFSWTVKADKQQVVIAGTYALNGNQLKLNRKDGGALEGKITVKNANQFVFKLKWQAEDESGVTFNRK